MAARDLTVHIIGDSRSLERAFSRSSKSASSFGRDMGKISRGAIVGTGALRGIGNAATFASTGFLGGAGLTFALTKAVQGASDLNEEMNKTRVVFRASARQVLAWSKTSATALGLSRVEALRAAGAFGAMLETAGVLPQRAASMSRSLVQLASDMASFNNEDPSDMLDRLRSGLAGEAEPLRRFSILLSEGAVKTEAVRSGIARSGKTLTEQQKVQARYNLILRQTAIQQGDFARTSGGLANQLRILRAQLSNVLAAVGQALLPIITRIVGRMNAWLESSRNQERVQRTVVSAVNFTVGAVEGMIRVVAAVKQAWEDFSRSVKRIWLDLQAGAVRAALAIVGPFTHIPEFLGGLSGKARDAAQNAKVALLAEMQTLRTDFNQLGRDSATEFGRGFKSSFPDIGPGMTLNIPTGTAAALAGGGVGGAARRTGATAQQRNAWFDAAIGRQIDRNQDIQNLRGQLADLRRIAGLIQDRINVTKDVTRKLTLEDQLVAVQRDQRNVLEAIRDRTRQLAEERKALEQQRAERLKAARTARQFRALGLTATGEDRIPIRVLRNQAERLTKAVQGTFLDTRKTKSLLAQIRRVLSGGLGAVGRDIKDKIRQILADLNRQLDDNANRSLTKFRVANTDAILAGAGLSPDQIRLLRARLAKIGAGGAVTSGGVGAFGRPVAGLTGTGGVVISGAITVVSNDPDDMARKLQKTARRRATQTTGPNAGNAMGTTR